MTLPFAISDISNSLGEKTTFLGDPMWVIWYTEKRLAARPGTYKTLLKEPWSKSMLPLPLLSVYELSPSKILGPFESSRHENDSFVETMCLEAP